MDAPIENDRVSQIVRDFPSTSYRLAFLAALEALLGKAGLYLAGQPGPGRKAFLENLISVVPEDRLTIVRLNADASPEAFIHLVEGVERESVWRSGRVLVVIDDADTLRRDTLELMDQSVTSLIDDDEAPQFLLVGRSSFEQRLLINQHHKLAAYLRTRLTLDPPAAPYPGVEAPAPVPDAAPPKAAGAPAQGGLRAAPQAGPPRENLVLAEAAMASSPTGGSRTLPWATGCMALIVIALLVMLQRNDAPLPVGAPAGAPVGARVATVTPGEPSRSSPSPMMPGKPAPASTPALGIAVPDLAGQDAPHAAAKPEAVSPAMQDRPVNTALPACPAPSPDATARNPAAPARVAKVENGQPAGDPGLLLIARPGDTLVKLYCNLYAGIAAPPFEDILAANPGPVQPGRRLIFPTPPGGWQGHPGG